MRMMKEAHHTQKDARTIDAAGSLSQAAGSIAGKGEEVMKSSCDIEPGRLASAFVDRADDLDLEVS